MITEKELDKIREEAEKMYPWPEPDVSFKKYYETMERICRYQREAHIAALTRERERVKEVESGIEILKELCQLKHYKDNVGKDAFYEKTQPELWAKANEFLNNYKNNK